MSSSIAEREKIFNASLRAFDQSFNYPDVKKAYLYRLEDRDKLQREALNKCEDEFDKDLEYLIHLRSQIQKENENALKNREQLITSLKKIKQVTMDKSKQEIIYAYLEDLTNDIGIEDMEDESSILVSINQNRSLARAEKELFKLFGTEDTTGMWYELPGEKHRWLYNLCWMWGHFMKGTNVFIIASYHSDTDIFDEGRMYRGDTSPCAGKFGSGFAREISCCLANGYQFQLNSNSYILYHPNPNFSSTNLPKLIFNPTSSIAEEKKLFEHFCQAMETYYGFVNLEIDQNIQGFTNEINGLIKNYTFNGPPKEIDRKKEKGKGKKENNVGFESLWSDICAAIILKLKKLEKDSSANMKAVANL